MSWSIGFDSTWNRDIGYGVPAYCDHPKCNAEINRGLAHVCGSEPYGGEHGCGLFFCDAHLSGWRDNTRVCSRCDAYKPPYKYPKPEHPAWMEFKMTDPSWEEWRKQIPGPSGEQVGP